MKAITYTEYGPPEVLHIKEFDNPVPKEDEILIKVEAGSVNYGDLLARNFGNTPRSQFNMPLLFWVFARMEFGISRPKKKILGSEYSGVVENTGSNVSKFKKGDKVFGFTSQAMGANAQYLCVSEKGRVATIPSGLTFEEAASVPYGALMALILLRKTKLKKGQKILIIGASGGIGSAAVQIAKNLYEAEVTGICSTPRIGYVRKLGADHVIDYKKEDFTLNGVQYDLIFDVLGKSSFSKCKRSLSENGMYFRVSFKTKHLLQMLVTNLFGKKKVKIGLAIDSGEDLLEVKKMVESGKFVPFVDKVFPMEEVVEAHKYIEQGDKAGSIVLTF